MDTNRADGRPAQTGLANNSPERLKERDAQVEARDAKIASLEQLLDDAGIAYTNRDPKGPPRFSQP